MSSASESTQLTDSSLPGLFQAADQASLAGQRRYLTASRTRLAFVLLAAAGGALSLQAGGTTFDLAAAGTAVALTATAFVEIWLLTEKPEQAWYDGRALAESARTVAWRYAVGADPFPKDGDEAAAATRVIDRLDDLLNDAPPSGIAPSTAPAVSQAMRDLRASPLDGRKSAYIQQRIVQQQDWYSGKARWNQGRARRWGLTLVAVEVLGILTALLRAFGYIRFDLAGIVAAMIGVGVAWLAIKQHDTLARAYAVAANELSIVRSRLELVQDEQVWAGEASDAEEAISREHTMWRASRRSL
ncbi:DUF4231 domain-containing protein [Nonomuraea sediminis]|uniref:DUF4231 domain-containing protein n=1 Tax=Nonomuraea sediminis TaxID=2835864 RepID=UPI001BDCAE72|nr:DUF4231 domain-containing protein [Nonomuraea sediminis]